MSESFFLIFLSLTFTYTHTHTHTQLGSFNPPKFSPSVLFHQVTSIIHEVSQHPQRVAFPLLQPNTSKLIHCSQYCKSQNNKGVTLQLMHSCTHTHPHTHTASTVHAMEELTSVATAYQEVFIVSAGGSKNLFQLIRQDCTLKVTVSIYI